MDDSVGSLDIGLNDIGDGLADDGVVALLLGASVGRVGIVGESHLDHIL